MTTPAPLLPAPVAAPTSDELVNLNALAEALAASRYFKEATDKARAAVKILYGRELGLGPVQALLGIDFSEKGSLTLRAHTIAALIRRSQRYDYRVKQQTEDGCEIEFYEVDWTDDASGPKKKLTPIGVSRFGPADAKRAQLSSKSTYQQHPIDMYYNRAMAKGARMHCPDVFGAPAYIPDEVDGILLESRPAPEVPTQAAVATAKVPVAAATEAEPVPPASAVPAAAPSTDGRLTAADLGADPATLPDALQPDPPAPVDPAELAVLDEVVPQDVAVRILALAPGTVLSNADANDVHGYLVDFLGGGKDGAKKAREAWALCGVTVAKGVQITREQVLAVAKAVNVNA